MHYSNEMADLDDLYSQAVDYLFDDELESLHAMLINNPKLVDYQPGSRMLTLLHIACQEGKVEVASMLLDEVDADPMLPSQNDDDLGDALPIHYAAYYNSPDCIQLLCDHEQAGEMLSSEDGMGFTPFLQAVSNASSGAIDALISRGCNVNDEVGNAFIGCGSNMPQGTTALCVAIEQDDESTALYLLEKCQEIDVEECGPLIRASQKGMFSLVTKLLQKGASPSVIDENGFTPLDHAVSEGHIKVLKVLYDFAILNPSLNFGINDKSKTKKRTLLLEACKRGQTQIAHYLMWFPNVDLLAKDYKGLTALGIATRRDNHELVQKLTQRMKTEPNRRLPEISLRKKRAKLVSYLADDMDEMTAKMLVDGSDGEYMFSQARSYAKDPDENKLLAEVACAKSDKTFKRFYQHPKLRSETVQAVLSSEEQPPNKKRKERLRKRKADILMDEHNIGEPEDSDDEDYSPDPSISLIPTVELSTLGGDKSLIANFRGEQYQHGEGTQETRRKRRARDPRLFGQHSSASYDLLEKGYQADALSDELSEEQKLAHYDEQVRATMWPMKQAKYTGKKTQPQTDSEADFQSYIHRYDEHLKELAGEGDQQTENAKRLAKYRLPFTQNPNLSYSDCPKVALKFATGVNAASRELAQQIKIRSTGRAHSPFIGEVTLVLHSQAELKANGSDHAPTLIKQKRLGVKHMYRHALERRYIGGIPKESFAEKIVIKIPSFDTYLPHYEPKYGLTKSNFKDYRCQLRATNGNIDAQQAILKRFLNELIAHLDSSLFSFAEAAASERGATLAFDDWEGAYTDTLKRF